MTAVDPLITVGDPLENINPDTIRAAYAKYNQHTHGKGVIADFRYYGIELGGPAALFNDALENLLPNTAAVQSINGNLLIVDQVTTNTEPLTNLTFVQGTIEIPNCSITGSSSNITVNERAGFLSATSLAQLATAVVSNSFTNPLNVTYPLVMPGTIDGYVVKVQVMITSGSITDFTIHWVDTDGTSTLGDNVVVSEVLTTVDFPSHSFSSNTLLTSDIGLGIVFGGTTTDTVVSTNVVIAKVAN